MPPARSLDSQAGPDATAPHGVLGLVLEPVDRSRDVPRERPGMAPGERPGELPGDAPTGGGDPEDTQDRDWAVWWGTFASQPGARIQVWRVQENGLNAARPVLMLTVEDAQREGLAHRADFLDYLASRFGAGRFRLSPRLANGEKPRGSQSLTVVIPEDSAMQVVMRPPAPAVPPPPPAGDRETLIEVERMRLVAEREREREEARERHRQEREDRRREREEARERRRQEAAARAEAEERRRAERDERMQATLLSMMKDVAAAAGGRREPDPLTQALLTKVLEQQETRTDLSDFIKTQAEMGRLNAQTMMDQWRTMMQMSTETQARLISQAVETAAQRDSGGFWDAAGAALAQALPTIVARWSPAPRPAHASLPAPPVRRLAIAPPRPLPASPPAATQPTAPPSSSPAHHAPDAPMPTTAAPDPSRTNPAEPGSPSPITALRLVQAIHQGQRPDYDDSLDAVLDALTDPMADAIAGGDQAALFAAVEPALRAEPGLVGWLGSPGVGAWLDGYLHRLRSALVADADGTSDGASTPAPHTITVPRVSEQDAVI